MHLEENVPLSKYTSLHVGGPARYFIRAKNDRDVRDGVLFAHQHGVPFMPLGQGSNTIFPDSGYDGVIIHMEDRTLHQAANRVTAGSGVFMRQLVNFCLRHGLRGLEELAGIPGTVGGAVRGNAGTWSTETKDYLMEIAVVRAEADTASLVSLKPPACEFAYRTSIFKRRPDWIVVRATFALRPGDPGEGQALVELDYQQRHAKQPYDAPSAGSIFTNPDTKRGIFSGQLIESCGLKGWRVGGAEISHKHANFIVNRGQASASDVLTLIRRVQAEVFKQRGVKLEPEVHLVER